MNRHHPTGPAAAVPVAALAVAGLLLAGCGSSSAGSGSGSGPGSAGPGSTGSAGSQANTSATAGSSGGSNSGATAGSPLFPISVGEKWVYADRLGGLGSSTTTINTIKAVKPVSGGELVTMTDASRIAGAPAKPVRLTYMFYSDGSIGVPLTQLAGGGKVTIKSGSIVWPSAAAIASGQSHTSTLSISIKTSGLNLNEKIHVIVKGAGTQSVAVPAGTYQATVVDQTMAEKVLGHPVTIEIRTWLAPGVGPVKSEVLDKSSLGGGGPQTVQELKSFTK